MVQREFTSKRNLLCIDDHGRVFMREDIVFKGSNGELQLLFNESVDFAAVLNQLKAKLAAAADFFGRGTPIKLPATLTAEQRAQIAGVLTEHGLACKEEAPVCHEAVAGAREKLVEANASADKDRYQINALVVGKTLRSGQKVSHDGSIIIMGDVNPGAQVIAGEDIIILGSCRGMAHAGANGNERASITANKIVATQLRIAGLIARSPDDLDKSVYVQTARIKDGHVIIEPVNR